MKKKNRSQLAATSFALLAMSLSGVGCGDENVYPNPDVMMMPATPLCGGEAAEALSGNIDKDLRLVASKRWLLVGQVKVTGGATLTIEAGTTVCGDATDPTRVSYLNVDQGSKLIAEGSATQPIVFTSSKKQGERKTSDWGGVVVRGHAQINLPPGDGNACGMLEGNAGAYGPCGALDNHESSGVLKYVRIEFAGREVAPNNELNGLTLGGVGEGTIVDYVQVHRGSDDGFEMFGGTVNLRHLVATAGLDDAFDWDQGWQGKGQFWVAQQQLADGNNGFEGDNNRDNNSLQPRSSPTVYNVTLLGTGRGSAPRGEKRYGLTLRQGTDGKLGNMIVQGFGDMGVVVTQESTCAEIAADRLSITGTLFYDNGRDAATNLSTIVKVGNADCDIKAWLMSQGNRDLDPELRRPYDHNIPDFRPRSTSPALIGVVTTPADPFFTAADYIGAFAADESGNWLEGWTAFPEN
jgi:hypothetical protein